MMSTATPSWASTSTCPSMRTKSSRWNPRVGLRMCRSRCDTTDAGRAVLGALGAAGWAAGRFPAVTVPPPRRPRVDAHAPRPAQGLPPRRHRIDEDPQRRRPLAAVIALEGAPLALVGGEVRTGADQG